MSGRPRPANLVLRSGALNCPGHAHPFETHVEGSTNLFWVHRHSVLLLGKDTPPCPFESVSHDRTHPTLPCVFGTRCHTAMSVATYACRMLHIVSCSQTHIVICMCLCICLRVLMSACAYACSIRLPSATGARDAKSKPYLITREVPCHKRPKTGHHDVKFHSWAP